MINDDDQDQRAEQHEEEDAVLGRRQWLRLASGGGLAAAGAALVLPRLASAQGHDHHGHNHGGPAPASASASAPASASASAAAAAPASAPAATQRGNYQPVIVPNGRTLPYRLVDGVKVFHLIAEPIKHTFTDGLSVDTWGYNGGTPGPLIEAVEGDTVRFYVTNRLPEPTTVHWHGLFVPSGMDGVSGLNQKPIQPGETFRYEFKLTKPGTFMYHPHFDEMIQIALGMTGMFVVHPKQRPALARPLRDYSLMLHEWKVEIGAKRPNPMAMNDFNVLTLNSKCFPSTQPLVAEVGDLVRIRIGNLGPMDSHPVHLHGYAFEVTYTDGGPVPKTARWPETTIIVPVGSCRVIEFIADAPGDWAFHCHMTHHVMNQMGHEGGNIIGAKTAGLDDKLSKQAPGYMVMGEAGMGDMMQMRQPANSISMRGGEGPYHSIDMGGMFTILKVRNKLPANGDAGWYQAPSGTVARAATAAELKSDGIVVGP